MMRTSTLITNTAKTNQDTR